MCAVMTFICLNTENLLQTGGVHIWLDAERGSAIADYAPQR